MSDEKKIEFENASFELEDSILVVGVSGIGLSRKDYVNLYKWLGQLISAPIPDTGGKETVTNCPDSETAYVDIRPHNGPTLAQSQSTVTDPAVNKSTDSVVIDEKMSTDSVNAENATSPPIKDSLTVEELAEDVINEVGEDIRATNYACGEWGFNDYDKSIEAITAKIREFEKKVFNKAQIDLNVDHVNRTYDEWQNALERNKALRSRLSEAETQIANYKLIESFTESNKLSQSESKLRESEERRKEAVNWNKEFCEASENLFDSLKTPRGLVVDTAWSRSLKRVLTTFQKGQNDGS